MSIKKTKYISASQVEQFLFCPVNYKLLYVDNVQEKEPPNVYMLYGDALHQALAYNYTQKISSKKDLDHEEVKNFFTHAFESGIESCVINKYDNPKALVLTGELVLYRYLQEVAPFYQPLEVEQKFFIPLKNYPITIFGFIDLVVQDLRDGKIGIVDHKSAPKKHTWTQKKADNSFQMTMYSVAYRKRTGKKEDFLQFDVLPRDIKPQFKLLRTARKETDIIPFLQLCTRIEEAVLKDFWYPNLSNCSDCFFNSSCTKLSYGKTK